jgi:hypothetical protein
MLENEGFSLKGVGWKSMTALKNFYLFNLCGAIYANTQGAACCSTMG